MPAIQAPSKVLVTGANGFIAGWIIKDLLTHGFSVRGVIRAEGKGDALRTALTENVEKLEFVVVPDITLPGAFDSALEGVDAIVHTASPVTVVCDHPDELIVPALQGTISILRSACRPGSSVKRIIYVSSLAAVVDNSRPIPATFSEADWNESDVAEVKEKAAAASGPAKYRTSKTLAERAAWDCFNEGKEKGSIGWDLVSLNPPWVFGPPLGARTLADLTTLMRTWYKIVVTEDGEIPAWSRTTWVDVRDFARATLAALVRPEAGGERFIIANASFLWKEWIPRARRLLGKPGTELPSASELVYEHFFDATKSRKMLNMQYRDMDESTTFIIEDFKKKGWC
ncbi:NAD(P)-binding protein [Epithele typhae]|uniref:NAD(P)-binding protein n=1 Tax=Epithele typhae TaxID=378194 RepID=UPI0020081B39|nr:NAD(P)-binding protein [Epithele typhae]KAH9941821.1 NAD(P)-binding protein [Epithele typhae]